MGYMHPPSSYVNSSTWKMSPWDELHFAISGVHQVWNKNKPRTLVPEGVDTGSRRWLGIVSGLESPFGGYVIWMARFLTSRVRVVAWADHRKWFNQNRTCTTPDRSVLSLSSPGSINFGCFCFGSTLNTASVQATFWISNYPDQRDRPASRVPAASDARDRKSILVQWGRLKWRISLNWSLESYSEKGAPVRL